MIAAVLKETIISELKCATTRQCSLLCQHPLTLPPSWQLGLQSNLRPPHHQAVRRAQGQHRYLAQVRHRPRMFAFLSAPADTHLPSHCAPTHPSQYREQPHRSRGRRRARSRPQGDDDLQPQVCRDPIVFAFLSAPIDTPPFLGSLGNTQLCGVYNVCINDIWGRTHGTYTAEGITKLCDGLTRGAP